MNLLAFTPARRQPYLGRIAPFEQALLWLERTDARVGCLREGKAYSARNRGVAALALRGIVSVSPLRIV